MGRVRRTYVCRECGAEFPAWAGRCSRCQAWATVEEVQTTGRPGARTASAASGVDADVRSLASYDADAAVPTPTGIDELDRVLGGGLTAGSAILLGGEPGIGKSTLTLQLAIAVVGRGASALIVAGEEAPSQVAARARRLGPVPDGLTVVDDISVEAIIAAMEQERPLVAIVDSIQTVATAEVDGVPGSIGQVRASAAELVGAAKRLNVSIVLVGHLTKDGALAGPKAVEHLVDTVLSFGGDPGGELRFLRASKHRFGPTTDVGLFEMTGSGLAPVSDPAGRFLVDRQPGLPGSTVVPVLEGLRPVLVEVQALTVPTGPGGGSQVRTQGVDGRRLAMVAAVLGRRARCPVSGHELFVSSTGGAQVTEPGADVGLAVALVSSLRDLALPPDLVTCGEIGLGGELRSVPRMEGRLQEAYRMGFRSAIVPTSAPSGPTGMAVMPAATLSDVVSFIEDRRLAA